MKIMTIIGTRPEIIRLSLIIAKLDNLTNHILVHTGQNFNPNLSSIFFRQLAVRKPDHYLDIGRKNHGFAVQVGQIISKVERLLILHKPDKVLILGDTNSGLSSIVAKRLSIPVYHMEAGNRCYDDKVPEEINRRIIDHTSDILMPYTRRSKDNLLKEGIDSRNIYVIGNPIFEVINHFKQKIENSLILKELIVNKKGYFLITIHRAENINDKNNLVKLYPGLLRIYKTFHKPIICSLHPHTHDKLKELKLSRPPKEIRFCKPFGFFDFVKLEQNAFCVLSDSGTVQEECCILRVPSVTLREVTERPETLECGSNLLCSLEGDILKSIQIITARTNDWVVPREYLFKTVSDTVVNILCSKTI